MRCDRGAQPRRPQWVAGAWVLVGLLGVFGTAAAAPADQCAGSANETDLLRCRQDQVNSVDSRVRQVLDKLRERYQDDEPRRWKLLATSQEMWRAFLQAECSFRTYESASGSAHQIYLLSCLADLTERRLQDLNAIVANP